jgi:hypothetical protein
VIRPLDFLSPLHINGEGGNIMSNKSVWMPVLLITVILIPGCISDKGNETNSPINSDLIPTANLPAGFTYMATHKATVDIGGSLINATEGVYRYNNKEDVYIQVIENDKPEALITQYRLRYKDANYNPFQEISFNNHKATQVTDYSTVNGQQKQHYSIIWTVEKDMVLVSSPTADAQAVIALATATGH